MLAEKKVLTNPDLLHLILVFLGPTIQYRCAVCQQILRYQIFDQIIRKPQYVYINLEACVRLSLCSEKCLIVYQKKNNNIRFCGLLMLILLLFGLLLGTTYIYINVIL